MEAAAGLDTDVLGDMAERNLSKSLHDFPPSCHIPWPWVVQVVFLAAQPYREALTSIFRDYEWICKVVCGYIALLAVSRLMQNLAFLSFHMCYRDNRRNIRHCGNSEAWPWDYREAFWNLGILAETWGILAKILFSLFSSVGSGIGKCEEEILYIFILPLYSSLYSLSSRPLLGTKQWVRWTVGLTPHCGSYVMVLWKNENLNTNVAGF